MDERWSHSCQTDLPTQGERTAAAPGGTTRPSARTASHPSSPRVRPHQGLRPSHLRAPHTLPDTSLPAPLSPSTLPRLLAGSPQVPSASVTVDWGAPDNSPPLGPPPAEPTCCLLAPRTERPGAGQRPPCPPGGPLPSARLLAGNSFSPSSNSRKVPSPGKAVRTFSRPCDTRFLLCLTPSTYCTRAIFV